MLTFPDQDFQMSNLTSLQLYDTIHSCFHGLVNHEIFSSLTFLKSLKIIKDNSSFNSFIDVRRLVHLVHLYELDTWDDDFLAENPDDLKYRYGENYEVIDSLKELRVAKLQILPHVDCAKLQEKHPEVRFQWCQKIRTSGAYQVDHFYEVEFSKGSIYGGKGVMVFPNGDRYEGEFNDGIREGRGTYFYANGDRDEV